MTRVQLTYTALFQEAASPPGCSALNWRALFDSLSARGCAHGCGPRARRWRCVLMWRAIALESLRRAYALGLGAKEKRLGKSLLQAGVVLRCRNTL